MKRFFKSFKYAIQGIREGMRSEENFKFDLVVALLVIISGFVYQLTTIEWSLVILCIVAVLAAELINSSIEKIVDWVSPEIHPEAKRIKDMAAGAVLIVAVGAAIIGMIIFLPKIISS